MRHHSRRSLRILNMLRTGHTYLKKYRFHRLHQGSNDHCFCHLPGQDLCHLLQRCPYPTITRIRTHLTRTARLIIDDYNIARDDDTPFLHIKPSKFLDLNLYLYPLRLLSIRHQIHLQQLIILLYRIARGYRPNRMRQATQSTLPEGLI